MGKKLDVLFIKPGNQKKLYGKLSSSLSGIEPPLWAALLAAYMRQKGYTVNIIDTEVERLSPAEVADRIIEENPVVAAIIVSGTNPSASTMNMTGTRNILTALKEKGSGIKTFLSGLHPSALPERTMKEEDVDFVCEGEGFSTLEELVAALKNSKSTEDDFSIKGLWYRKKGQIRSNPRAPNFQNLGTLPMPAWDLLPMKQYRAHNWHCFTHIHEREPYAVIYTSLGCPFKCSFCCINAIFGSSGIRYRPPEKVAEEVDYLVKNYGIKNIKVLDEMFALKPAHIMEFCDRMIALGHELNFWVYGRIDTVKDYMLPKMKRAGINWIAYGIEAGSAKVRGGVSKGKFTKEDIKKVVAMTQEAGIYICGNFIFGLPDDDMESMQETLDLAKELNCEYANLYSTMAFPGSQLYADAVQNEMPLPETWLGYSQFAKETFPLSTKYLTNAQVLRFRDQAFDEYHAQPRYREMIRGKFGEETLEHVEAMCRHKLERNLLRDSDSNQEPKVLV